MTIALMRHGQTDWNLAGRVQGHTDIPLNESGRAQAREAAESLITAGFTWSHITSSPLARARETAQIIATHLSMPLGDPLEALIEQNYGEAEGSSVAELDLKWPTREFRLGESSEAVAQRALDTIELLSTTHEGAPVLAVSHGAYIRRLIATLHGVDYTAAPRILNATFTTFERDTQGDWIITTINSQPADAQNPESTADAAPTPAFVTLGGSGAGVCTTDGVCH